MSRLRIAVVAIVVLVFAVQAFALYRAHQRATALEERMEKLKLEELSKAGDQVRTELGLLARDRARLEADRTNLTRQARALEKRAAELGAELTRRQAAGQRLIEQGTVDEVVAAGVALGFHPVRIDEAIARSRGPLS